MWVSKSNPSIISKDELDVISGATPKAGNLSYTWNLTDSSNKNVEYGTYNYFLEGSLRWKNSVIYTGTISISESGVTVTKPTVKYLYKSSGKNKALNSDSKENSMIKNCEVNIQIVK